VCVITRVVIFCVVFNHVDKIETKKIWKKHLTNKGCYLNTLSKANKFNTLKVNDRVVIIVLSSFLAFLVCANWCEKVHRDARTALSI
jgi:hypothetical protein